MTLRMQDNIYHEMILPAEAQEIKTKAREFTDRIVAPRAYEIATTPESKNSFPWDIFKALADEDFFKIPYASDSGGLGLKYPCCATVATVEELAYASNSIAAVYDVHCILAGHALEYGSDYIKEQYLRPLTKAEKIGCFATTEPTASSDLSSHSVKTTAARQGNKFLGRVDIYNSQRYMAATSTKAKYEEASLS